MFGKKNDEDVKEKIRDELELQIKYFEFAKQQMIDDRKNIDFWVKLASLIIFAIITAGYISSWRSMQQYRDQLKIDAETQVKISVSQIKENINEKFKEDNIKSMIISAAKELTNNEAYKQMSLALSAKVGEVRHELEASSQLLQDIQLANLDSRTAFDKLLEINKSGKLKHELKPEYDELVQRAIENIIKGNEQSVIFTWDFPDNKPKTLNDIRLIMKGGDFHYRRAALDSYPKGDKTFLPDLVSVIATANSIELVFKAMRYFNQETGQEFVIQDVGKLLSWWEANKEKYPSKAP